MKTLTIALLLVLGLAACSFRSERTVQSPPPATTTVTTPAPAPPATTTTVYTR